MASFDGLPAADFVSLCVAEIEAPLPLPASLLEAGDCLACAAPFAAALSGEAGNCCC